jgi:uncharacterized protein (DUF169 family)
MTGLAELAAELTDLLRLSSPPLAIAFSSGPVVPGIQPLEATYPPPAADGRTGAVPAGCVFWTVGLDRVFSTTASDHANCSVGSYTHGFKSLAEVADKGDVGALFQSGWVTEADIPHIATVKDKPGSVAYGPLAEFPAEPDVVFLRLNPKQAMVLDDALGGVRYEGKPQCHIVAIAKDSGEVAVSVGCMLSRVRTRMSNNEMTAAIPGRRLPEVIEKLRSNAATERLVAQYAAEDSARFA